VERTLPKAYDERPQAFIKHRLLESYLQKLFLIVGTQSRELCYIDCFAGPWGDESDEMAATSIAISLSTLDTCRKMLGARGGSLPTVRALYIEANPARYARLARFVGENTPDGIEAEHWHGDFVAMREKICAWIGPRAFAFFFIDPKGWKEIGVPTLRPLLCRKRSEFLVNFMYNNINRTVSMPEWQEAMKNLLGQTLDVEDLEPEERERHILRAYRTSCKSEMLDGSKYPARSAYARVLDPMKERPKYHLVYFTTHPRGIVEFMTISQGVDFVQRQVRAELKLEKHERKVGMNSLFGPEPLTEQRAKSDEIDLFWRNHLIAVGGKRRIGLDQFAEILEKTDWFPDSLQASLARLIEANQVRNLDASRLRPKRPLHFEANANLGEWLELEGYK
jgi:three-Cys-motif partner protein